MRVPPRVGALATVAVLVGLAGTVSVTAATRPPGTGVEPDALVALAPAASSFFCGALENVPGEVRSTVAIANLSGESRVAEVTVSDQEHHVTHRTVPMRAGEVVRLHPGTMLPGAVEGVSVLSSGGGLDVTEALAGTAGEAAAPCLTTTSTSWWLTGGSTFRSSSFLLELYNPTPSRAVATVTLTTPQGSLAPPGYGGIVLDPYEVLPLVVRSVAPNQSPVTARVVVSDGAMLAEGIQRGVRGTEALDVLPGTPSATPELDFPAASSRWPLRTTLELYTSSSAATTATVEVLPSRSGCASGCPAPPAVRIPANGAVVTYEVPTTSVPIGEAYALVVRAGGSGVLGTEVVSDEGVTGESVPSNDPFGVAGSTLVLVDPLGVGFARVGVLNPSPTAVTVRLLTPSSRTTRVLGTYRVGPDARIVLGPGQLAGMDARSVLELSASGPISAAGIEQGATAGAGTLVGTPAAG